MNANSSSFPLYPGSTLGMIGGGQLGRMFAAAATAMGYKVAVYCGGEDEPAAQIAHHCVIAPLDDVDAAANFARQCDAVTLEFENIPAQTIAACAAHVPTRPGHRVLATAQHRGVEKTTLRDAGLPVTPFELVKDKDQIAAFAERNGWPVIVKTCRSGYDGRGQYRFESLDELSEFEVDQVGEDGLPVEWIAERFIAFDFEVSVVVARRAAGEVSTFPMFRNRHRHHILDLTTVPAQVSDQTQKSGVEIAVGVAEHLELEGVLCVEFFVVDGELMINEIAPRPHNSGHVTIEACHTSQFEQQVRAVCNLPLGNPNLRVPAAGMLNLVAPDETMPTGDNWKRWSDAEVNLHWYGKSQCSRGRKMGHISHSSTDLRRVVEHLESLRW